MSITVEDRLAIHELLAKHCHYLDTGQGDAWARLWTEDAVRSGISNPAFPDTGGFELLRHVPAMAQQVFGGKMQHDCFNIIIEPGPDKNTAKVMNYGHNTMWGPGGGKLISATREYYTLVKADGEWKIKAKHTQFVHDPRQDPELAALMPQPK